MDNITIKFDEKNKESQAYDGDKKIGYCQYEVNDDSLSITHTVVDKEYGGQGIAQKLLDEVVAYARDKSAKIMPVCSYAVKRFDEDSKYNDVDLRYRA